MLRIGESPRRLAEPLLKVISLCDREDGWQVPILRHGIETLASYSISLQIGNFNSRAVSTDGI